MTTVTGLTAARMLEIEAASVVDGDVVGDDLFLTKKDGSLINAGNVRGPRGNDGPMGHPFDVLASQQVFDVGVTNQIRAGRQLALADFTNMGLSAPIALWNLSSVADGSGNARNLTNKGTVPFGVGINGAAASAAALVGSTAQALYIADTGAADPFRIKTGSFGCWFRSAKRGVSQYLVTKVTGTAATNLFALMVSASNLLQVVAYDATTSYIAVGATDICDDRWHFLVGTVDGTKVRAYVDGVLEATVNGPALTNAGSGPINIGSYGADAATAASLPAFGRVDEAFVTGDVLSLEQIRNLYAASIPHALGSVPSMFSMTVRRKRRGAPTASTDFPAQPVRLYNFTGGAYTDEGSNAITLTPNPGTGSIVDVVGAGGRASNAKQLIGAHTGLSGTDTGLPTGLSSRSYGLWFKTTSAAASGLISWGTFTTADVRVETDATGAILGRNIADVLTGPIVNDGNWHYLVIVEDNAAVDSKRKMYLDGRLVAASTVMNSITLVGANNFRLGARQTGASPLVGAIDGAFVYAGVLTGEQVRALYNIGAQQLAPKPKNAPDFIEASESARLLAVLDSIDPGDSVNLVVMG